MIQSGHTLPASYPATHHDTMTAQHPKAIDRLYARDPLPDSQDSYVSVASTNSTASRLLSSSSNVSNSTTADTEFTSPSSLAPSNQSQPPSQEYQRVVPPSPSQARGPPTQGAPRIDTANAPRTGDTAASPMSVEAPVLAQASKRTASGTVKPAGLNVNAAVGGGVGHRRNISVDSAASSNPRIGELSAQLKMRLSYAMVKVQNGWEKQSLEELEEASSKQASPISASGRSNGPRPFDSPLSAGTRQRRPSGVSDNSDQMLMSPGQGSPPGDTRSLAAASSYWRHTAKLHGAPIPATTTDNGPSLAPPAEIGSRRKRGSSVSYRPPPLLSSAQKKHYSDLGAMTSPRTPTAVTPRAGILRIPSQQAEKDAVESLLFMSSPNNSQRMPHLDGQAQPSPLRTEMAAASARRVMFHTDTKPPVMEHGPRR